MPKSGGGTVYVYQFEAARPDATATSPGGTSSRACSNASVLPWNNVSRAQAAAACAAVKDSTGASMRLCTAAEWQTACEGPGSPASSPDRFSKSLNPTTYQAGVCNDFNFSPNPAVWKTGTTGTVAGVACYTDWAALGKLNDMSGNLSEWTSTTVTSSGTTYYKIRGGNYGNLSAGTSCEFDFNIGRDGFVNSDIGFRCCADNAP